MVAIVTGASSGFGYEICKQLLEKGYKVYGISRRKLAPEGVTAFSADVSDESSVRAAVDEITHKEGRRRGRRRDLTVYFRFYVLVGQRNGA